jgi:mannose-6-phosphate isomerase
MLYPLKFRSVYKHYLWGGRALAGHGKILPDQVQVAESWEISGHPNGLSVVANGPLAGTALPDVIRLWGSGLMGSLPADPQRFPLLIKLIDAHESLSVQVHPDDAYALAHEGEPGKNEMWYVVAAAPDARLIAGVKPGVKRADFALALADGSCLDLLQSLPVKAGDVVNIPAGLVHAIGPGLVICEVQQNSDTTYRVFDYNRRDAQGLTRPLHTDKALDVISFDRSGPALIRGVTVRSPGLAQRSLVLNRYFLVEELAVDGSAAFAAEDTRFVCLTVLAGQGQLDWDGSGPEGPMPLTMGESILLPAGLSRWQISGRLLLLSARPAEWPADAGRLAQRAGFAPATKLVDPTRDALAWLRQQQDQGRLGIDPTG